MQWNDERVTRVRFYALNALSTRNHIYVFSTLRYVGVILEIVQFDYNEFYCGRLQFKSTPTKEIGLQSNLIGYFDCDCLCREKKKKKTDICVEKCESRLIEISAIDEHDHIDELRTV